MARNTVKSTAVSCRKPSASINTIKRTLERKAKVNTTAIKPHHGCCCCYCRRTKDGLIAQSQATHVAYVDKTCGGTGGKSLLCARVGAIGVEGHL